MSEMFWFIQVVFLSRKRHGKQAFHIDAKKDKTLARLMRRCVKERKAWLLVTIDEDVYSRKQAAAVMAERLEKVRGFRKLTARGNTLIADIA